MYANHTGVLLQTLFLIVQNNDTVINESAEDAVTKPSKLVTTPTPQEVCYGEFGCFSTGYPWLCPSRMFSYIPEDPEKVNTKFCLRTRFNKERCQMLNVYDKESVYKTHFVPKHKHYFIIHGYLENMNRSWMQRMTAELLRVADVNVVIVDWSGGSLPPYAQATANIRLVGAMTAHLIKNLIKEVGVRAEDIHIIGHSLGAHTASYVGNTIRTDLGLTVGRITGLDPAEPFFTETDPVVRLDPTDAIFVDAIHTDASPFAFGGMGIRQPVGHVDFYPNGGRNQPGCSQGVTNYIEEKGSMVLGLEKFLNCNHVRSNEFFINSFAQDCPFWGVQCESWEHFKNGSCFNCHSPGTNRSLDHHAGPTRGPRCARMGFYTQESIDSDHVSGDRPMKVFLMTADTPPYCVSHYRITVRVSNSTKSRNHGGEVGVMSVAIKGSTGETTTLQINSRERFFEPGSMYRQVIGGSCVGSMLSATLIWEYRTSVNPLTWRFLTTPRVFLHKVTIDSLEQDDRMTIIPQPDTPLITRQPLDCSRVSEYHPVSECQVTNFNPLTPIE